jgi:hypothetical protein
VVPRAEADWSPFNNLLPYFHNLDSDRIAVLTRYRMEQLQNTSLLYAVTGLELSFDLFHCSGLPHKPEFIRLSTEISLGGNDAHEKQRPSIDSTLCRAYYIPRSDCDRERLQYHCVFCELNKRKLQ